MLTGLMHAPKSEVKTLPVVADIIFCTRVTGSPSTASSALVAMAQRLPRGGARQVVGAQKGGRAHVRVAAAMGEREG